MSYSQWEIQPGLKIGRGICNGIGRAAQTSFTIDDGLAMSNKGRLDDGNPANVHPLNQAAVKLSQFAAAEQNPQDNMIERIMFFG